MYKFEDDKQGAIMKDTEKMDVLRLEYMNALADLAGLASDRDSHIATDMGMNALRSPQEAEESKQIVKKATSRIAEVCNKLRSIEQRAKGCIGIPVLFDADVPNVIRVVIAFLAGKATSGIWMQETRYLSTLLQPAGGSNPGDLLAVREAFRKTGLLRPYVHCESGRTLDELCDLVLTETSYRKLLALEPDSECDDLAEARKLVAFSGKHR